MARGLGSVFLACALALDVGGLALFGVPLSAVCVLIGAALVLLSHVPHIPVAPWVSVAVCAAACAAPGLGHGESAREAIQYGLILGVGWFAFANVGEVSRRFLRWCLVGLFGLSVLWQLIGHPTAASGTRLSLLGAIGFAVFAAQTPKRTLWVLPLGAGIAALALPHGGLVALGVLAAAAICWQRTILGPAIGAIVVAAAVLLVMPDKWHSMKLAHADGYPKRLLLEMQATPRAVAAEPFGSGLGSYRTTIGSYFTRFPAAHDAIIEPDTNSTLLLAAVEGGLPLVIAWLALFAFLLTHRREPHQRTLMLLLLGASLLTTLLTKHTGLSIAAVVGLWGGTWQAAGAGKAIARFSVLLVAIVIGLVRSPQSTEKEAPKLRILEAGVETLSYTVLEAENPLAPPTGGMRISMANDASQNQVLEIPADAGKGDGLARYQVRGSSGRQYLWLRVRWQDGCGNSVGVVAGDQQMVVSDSQYGVWHWLRAPRTVEATENLQFAIQNLEDGVMVDQVLLTPHEDLIPSGIALP